MPPRGAGPPQLCLERQGLDPRLAVPQSCPSVEAAMGAARFRAWIFLSFRIYMSIQGGQYLDQAGSRVRRWTWPKSVVSPGPHVPLRPIFISLNQHVGVRILSQDKIVVSFLAMGRQAKFNVGTKVQVFLKRTGSSTQSCFPGCPAPAVESSHPWGSTLIPQWVLPMLPHGPAPQNSKQWRCTCAQAHADRVLTSPGSLDSYVRGCRVQEALPGRSPLSLPASLRVTLALLW